VLPDFAGVLDFGSLFVAPPEFPESPEEVAPDEDVLPSPLAADFDSEGEDEVPPDSLLRAFLRDSDG
jgi:hypothetical protein